MDRSGSSGRWNRHRHRQRAAEKEEEENNNNNNNNNSNNDGDDDNNDEDDELSSTKGKGKGGGWTPDPPSPTTTTTTTTTTNNTTLTTLATTVHAPHTPPLLLLIPSSQPHPPHPTPPTPQTASTSTARRVTMGASPSSLIHQQQQPQPPPPLPQSPPSVSVLLPPPPPPPSHSSAVDAPPPPFQPRQDPHALLFVGLPGAVFALSKRTGKTVWSRTFLPPARAGSVPTCIQPHPDTLALLVTPGASLFCVDAADGAMRWDNKLVGIGVGYGSMTFQTAERRFRPLRSRNDTTHHHRHSLHSSSSPPASPTAPPPRSPTATTAAASGGSGLLAYVASASTSAVATNSSVGTATAAAATEGHELLFASAGSKVYALHVETGQTVWVRQQYGPHLALLVEDGALFVVGGEEIAALDSLSGRKLWSVPNPRTGGIATVATMRSSPLTRPRNHDPSLPCPAPPPTPVPSPLLTAVFVGANGYVTLLEAERGHRIRPPQSRAATDDISVPHTWYEPVSVVPLRTSHTAIVTSRVSVRRVSLRDGRLLWDASIPGVGKTGLAGVVVGEGVPPLSRLAGQRSLRRRLRHAVSFHSDTAGRAGGFGNVEFAPGDGEDGASLAAEDVEDDGTEDGDGDDDDDGDVDDVEPLPAYTKDPETTAQQVLLAPPSPTPSMTAAPPPSLPLPSPPSSASSSATPPFTPSLPPPLPPSPPAAPAPSTFLKARPRSAPGMPSASSSSSSSQSAAPAPAAAASARHPFPPSDRLIVSVGGQTWAVDARSGRVLWKHAPFFLRRCAIGHLLADGDGKVYVAGDGRVDCLDAETGRLLWESKQIHERWAYLSTYGAGNGETNRTPDHDVLVSTML